MPGIQPEISLQRNRAQLWMIEGSLPILWTQRTQKLDPSCVQGFEKSKGHFDRSRLRIGEHGPEVLGVRLDDRFIFSEGQLKSNVGVHVAIGHVVDYLSDSPSAFA